MMKIVLATPIYPPEIGGPATYAQKLQEGMEKAGYLVSVVSYKGLRRIPQPFRIFLYFLKLFKASRRCDLIYAFSLMSCALPAHFCGRKTVIRIGGDYLWERAAEAGTTAKSLREYYEALPKSLKTRIISMVLRGVDKLIFTSKFQKDIYLKYFGINQDKTVVIPNPFPEFNLLAHQRPDTESQILYAGRFIKLKNLSRLVEAFGKVLTFDNPPILKIIGKGPELENLKSLIADLKLEDRITIAKPLPQESLWEEIRKSRFCVLPSLSEITPNFALECIKLGTPILLTRETGFYDIFKDDLVFIDPFDVEDIKNKMEFLLHENNLNNYRQKISRIDTNRNWKNIIEENIKIFDTQVLNGAKKVLFIGVTDCHPDRNPHLRKKYEGLSGECQPYILGKGGFLRRRVWNTEFYLLPSGFFWLMAIWLAFWLCLAKKIDIIVAQSPLMEGFFGVVLKKIFRKELIIEIHGDWEERLPAFRGLLTFFAKRALRRSDKIRAVADYLIFKAKKYAPDKPYFLFPTFTDLNDFLVQTDVRFDNYILFVGRNDRVKGIKYLKEAFSLIEKDFPDFKLVLIGEGLEEGKLSLAEVRNKMKNCYCLVLPSITEGLPRVIMEAMALAKPVVASRVGGVPDLVQDGQNGFLFEVGNAADLSDKLRVLLSDRDLAVKMGKNGKEFVKENFSNEKYIRNYIKMIYA